MIDKRYIRENIDELKQALENRNIKFDFNKITSLDNQIRDVNLKIEKNNELRNKLSSEIKDKINNNELEHVESLKQKVSLIKEKIDGLTAEYTKLNDDLNDILLNIPNIPDKSVPVGKDENDNVEIKKFMSPTKFDFVPLPHWDLAAKNDLIDFERATKIAGTRFVIYKNDGSKLIRALQAFTLDYHQQNGYTEFSMPVIVNEISLYGTGNLPKFKDDLFKIANSNYYLAPTGEIQMTNYYRNEILDENDFPFKFTTSTINFRSEAGSAGRDTRGVIRQHQFYKTEMVNLSLPSNSFLTLEEMTRNAEGILEALELPYRRIILCTGDMGFSSAKTYDIEVWLPSYNSYKEISSCSNCTDFQARRSKIRFKNKLTNKNELVHTLNGSGLAIDRLFAAVVENYQNIDGSITVPNVLVKYLNKKIIK